jgi:hypothetical protein
VRYKDFMRFFRWCSDMTIYWIIIRPILHWFNTTSILWLK